MVEATVVELREADLDGQRMVARDEEGSHWQVECLGEPVDVGARIRFAPLARSRSDHERRGELVQVVEAAGAEWVCRVLGSERGGALRLAPFSAREVPDLVLVERDARGARPGDRVVVAPCGGVAGRDRGRVGRGRRHRGPVGRHVRALEVRVVQILGRAGEPDADFRAIVRRHHLPERFSRRARIETEAIEPAPSSEETQRRVDLRSLPFVTIDPASALDHDDAVFAEDRPTAPALRAVEGVARSRPPAWHRRLWVAIADVSHFVTAGGFIDAEARRRGNSFYFPGRAIPMLPERLSSDLCSLRPGVDRRAMVVELRLDAAGRVCDALFHEATIRSRARLSYDEAAAWLGATERGGEEALGTESEPEWGTSLRCLDRIATQLSSERVADGAIALELPEVEIVVDEVGRPVDARLRERNRAHALIEEAMLAANRAVARTLDMAGRPALHRVHPPPQPARLEELRRLLVRSGVDVREGLEAPGALAGALEASRGLPAEERLHRAALRAMSRARYEGKPGGHYALRFDHYVHFTSPIRRYADLEVHRALRRLIRDESPEDEGPGTAGDRAERVAAWLSGRERLAVEAERDAEALAGCLLMAQRPDEVYACQVTGVTEFGLFVRLEAPAVSGLVPLRSLEGSWTFDPVDEALVQAGGRRRFEVGQTLRVRTTEIDPDRLRLTFGLVGRSELSGVRTPDRTQRGTPRAAPTRRRRR